ncbi:MAG: YesL family protein [Clostridiales bacterium]|nr:YesL family protein [Clostridiales bacterium]
MKFLQQDNSIVRLLNRMIDLIFLNVIWVVCSLPIVTLGATTTALYDVTLRMAFREDTGLYRAFFRAFRKNLKKGTLLFLLTAGVGAVLVLDFLAASSWDIGFRFVFQVVILSVGYFYLAAVSHAFPALAYFGGGVWESIRHGFLLAMKNSIFTIFIMLLDVLPILIFLFSPTYAPQALFVLLIIGFSLVAYLNSLHLARLFDPGRIQAIEEGEEDAKPEEDAEDN